MTARAVPAKTKDLQTAPFCICPWNDLRSPWQGLLVAWITGSGRRSAGIAGRLSCGIYGGGEEAGGRLRLRRQQKLPICRESTGATGLEPATSGVTGQFGARYLDNGGHRITLFMRRLRPVPERLARLSGAVGGVCCPFAVPAVRLSKGLGRSLPLRAGKRGGVRRPRRYGNRRCLRCRRFVGLEG
jgi:hypothetical protein